MASRQLVPSVVCLAALLVSSSCVQPTEESYEVYSLLQKALVNGSTDGVPNLYILEANFYPPQKQSPICIPVKYILFCTNSTDPSCLEEDAYSMNISFLWAEYDLEQPIGALLLSYASSGIILKGFDWVDACIKSEAFQLNLVLNTTEQFNESAFETALLGITSQVSVFLMHLSIVCPTPSVRDWDDKEI